MNKGNLFVIVALILLCILGIFLIQTVQKSSHSTSHTPNSKLIRPLPKIVTVTLNKDGFSPKTVTIAVGSAVIWKNISGSKQSVNSDKYPTNQLHKELNFGIFDNGSSVTHTFTKSGTYGYHNQLNSTQTGEIIVN